MQFSETWLRTLVDPPLTSAELAHLLTAKGQSPGNIDFLFYR